MLQFTFSQFDFVLFLFLVHFFSYKEDKLHYRTAKVLNSQKNLIDIGKT